jgi:hypothetical protein
MIKRLEKAERRKNFPLKLDDDHLIAVGHVAIRSAMLDKLIDLTFAQIIGRHPKTIKTELEKSTSPKRINIIKDDLIGNMPENANAIADFISEIFSAREERNDILHRMWRQTETPDVKALVEVTRDAPELLKRKVTAKSMRDTADHLLDLAIELGDWKLRANDALLRRSAASPGISHLPAWHHSAPRTSPKDQR